MRPPTPPRPWLRAFLSLVTLSVLATAALPTAAAGATPDGDGAPQAAGERTLALGTSLLAGSTPWFVDDRVALADWVARMGRAPASYSIWRYWDGVDTGFPKPSFLSQLDELDITPVIFWQPCHPDVNHEPWKFTYERIAAGDWDPFLREFARDAATYGERVIVRFAHEMNGDWFPWSVGRAGNDPAAFVAAWRRIHDVVQEIAPNVKFLWAPIFPAGGYPLKQIWPGDEWVEYVGFTMYEWEGDGLPPFEDLIAPGVRDVMALSKRPIIVAETSIAGNGSADRRSWIADGLAGIWERHPRVAGILWFDVDMRWNHHPDWSLREADGSANAWRKALAKESFAGRL